MTVHKSTSSLSSAAAILTPTPCEYASVSTVLPIDTFPCTLPPHSRMFIDLPAPCCDSVSFLPHSPSWVPSILHCDRVRMMLGVLRCSVGKNLSSYMISPCVEGVLGDRRINQNCHTCDSLGLGWSNASYEAQFSSVQFSSVQFSSLVY